MIITSGDDLLGNPGTRERSGLDIFEDRNYGRKSWNCRKRVYFLLFCFYLVHIDQRRSAECTKLCHTRTDSTVYGVAGKTRGFHWDNHVVLIL